MPTTFVKGDILEETPAIDGKRVLAFGADVDGSMESGIAIALRKRWPELAEAWAARCAGGRMQLGDAFAWKSGDLVVYALGIQRGGGKPKVSWLERALQAMTAAAAREGITRISVPRLAAGKNGLDGSRVKRVLTEVGDMTPVELVVFEQFIRAKPAEAPPVETAEEAPAAKRKTAAKKKTSAKKKTAAKKKTSAKKKTAAKKSSAKKKTTAKKKTASKKKTAK